MEEEGVLYRLANFDSVWEVLTPSEQVRVAQLLIERVEFDGSGGSVSITFPPTGIRELDTRFGDGEAA